MASERDISITKDDLPLTFQVKYLGSQPAKGLWGIKHTRRPVDIMVKEAKNLPPDVILPLVNVTVSTEGLQVTHVTKKKSEKSTTNFFKISTISYGVQDLVYTRVFSMIVVTDGDLTTVTPFDCHGFVCQSRNEARQLTYALAAAFQEYGKKFKEESQKNPDMRKKFAIDLRTPEQQNDDSDSETEA
ncbi:uncharacterized protein LOC108736479 [Agrilus planipennis]|uniref:Uncharacterized protein LOC108736479 n=1 Tax=Agrilus planipennis TaxID=224129 RepID=A0A1W4WV95_AGRPL|nr:uncharacterized protein LOC108736479 [Agrilus planipennis]